jgi:hypothetical protein
MESMVCPVCHQPMVKWKVKSAYDQKKKIEYRREHYRCEKDDVWGRYEIPVGPMREYGLNHSVTVSPSA